MGSFQRPTQDKLKTHFCTYPQSFKHSRPNSIALKQKANKCKQAITKYSHNGNTATLLFCYDFSSFLVPLNRCYCIIIRLNVRIKIIIIINDVLKTGDIFQDKLDVKLGYIHVMAFQISRELSVQHTVKNELKSYRPVTQRKIYPSS